jgi:inward rectifier potassium channel
VAPACARRRSRPLGCALRCSVEPARPFLGPPRAAPQTPAVTGKITLRPPGASYEIHVLGGQSRPLRDFYHALLRASWPVTLGLVAAIFLAINALFALIYLTAGGVANARPGSFVDAFFFSVETMGTIGYGAMYPQSDAANWWMVVESVVGVILTALATGLLFAKFSRPSARIVFTRRAVICPFNGVPTLMFRVGNERGNAIVDALFRVVVTRTEHTREGEKLYRSYDLELVRERVLSLNRSFNLLHVIDERSPFFGQTPRSITEQEYELAIVVVGIDDTVLQTVHARHNYDASAIVWGARLADVLSDLPDGSMQLDLHKFHDVEPSKPTEGFPYP